MEDATLPDGTREPRGLSEICQAAMVIAQPSCEKIIQITSREYRLAAVHILDCCGNTVFSQIIRAGTQTEDDEKRLPGVCLSVAAAYARRHYRSGQPDTHILDVHILNEKDIVGASVESKGLTVAVAGVWPPYNALMAKLIADIVVATLWAICQDTHPIMDLGLLGYTAPAELAEVVATESTT